MAEPMCETSEECLGTMASPGTERAAKSWGQRKKPKKTQDEK